MKVLALSDKYILSQSCVITIGVFDGVHLGHQSLINEVIKKAKESNLPAVLICFHPQPKEFFNHNNSSFRINLFRDKIINLKKTKLDAVIVLKFNKKFSLISAKDFVVDILIKKINAKSIVIGDDFRFGFQQKGDLKLLNKLSHNLGFITYSIPSYIQNNNRISSTLIREYLKEYNFSKAKSLLGYDYQISSRVHHGDKIGRTINFPTINIPLKFPIIINGVFLVKVYINSTKQSYFGVANIGIRPTVGGKKRILEVHLLNYSGDLYGCHVSIIFVAHIRDEIKFNSFEDLKNQIVLDIITAKNIIKKSNQ